MLLYHGTARKFDRFNPYSFFTDLFGVADIFAQNKSLDEDSPKRVLLCEVDLGKVLEIDHARVEATIGKPGHKHNHASYDWDQFDTLLRQTSILADFDTIIVQGLRDSGYENFGRYPQYFVRDPKSIRIVDEVVAPVIMRRLYGCKEKDTPWYDDDFKSRFVGHGDYQRAA